MARVLVIGSSNTDLTVRVARLPTPGQTVLGGDLRRGPGGKGANQAVAAARAGGSVVFLTAVGDDAFGPPALDACRAEGVDVSQAQTVAGSASGVALILVGEAGENMITVAPGANARLTPGDVDRLPADLFRPGGLLLVAGLEIPTDAVARAVLRASGAGLTVVLNPAPAADLPPEVLAGVDVITPNRHELAHLTGDLPRVGRELAGAARALRDLGPRAVVATLGAEGCFLSDAEGDRLLPPHPVEAVDTVGAGDAFNGALAVALAEGRPLGEAAAWANAAAALAVTRPGAQAALPRRPEIDRLAATRSRP